MLNILIIDMIGLKCLTMVNYKNPNERASEFVGVRVSIDEKKNLETLATKAGMSVSKLIRLWIREKIAQIKGIIL